MKLSAQGLLAEALMVGQAALYPDVSYPHVDKALPFHGGEGSSEVPLPPGSQLVPRRFGELSISLCCWQVGHPAVEGAKSTLRRERLISIAASLDLGPLSKQ